MNLRRTWLRRQRNQHYYNPLEKILRKFIIIIIIIVIIIIIIIISKILSFLDKNLG